MAKKEKRFGRWSAVEGALFLQINRHCERYNNVGKDKQQQQQQSGARKIREHTHTSLVDIFFFPANKKKQKANFYTSTTSPSKKIEGWKILDANVNDDKSQKMFFKNLYNRGKKRESKGRRNESVGKDFPKRKKVF